MCCEGMESVRGGFGRNHLVGYRSQAAKSSLGEDDTGAMAGGRPTMLFNRPDRPHLPYVQRVHRCLAASCK